MENYLCLHLKVISIICNAETPVLTYIRASRLNLGEICASLLRSRTSSNRLTTWYVIKLTLPTCDGTKTAQRSKSESACRHGLCRSRWNVLQNVRDMQKQAKSIGIKALQLRECTETATARSRDVDIGHFCG